MSENEISILMNTIDKYKFDLVIAKTVIKTCLISQCIQIQENIMLKNKIQYLESKFIDAFELLTNPANCENHHNMILKKYTFIGNKMNEIWYCEQCNSSMIISNYIFYD